jgi:hypothetical protein
MGKLARIVTCVFGAWPSHVGAKRCYRSKISEGGFIMVTSGLMGHEKRRHDQVPLVSRRCEKIYNVVHRSSRRLQGYTHTI